jgi:hypothetical protein
LQKKYHYSTSLQAYTVRVLHCSISPPLRPCIEERRTPDGQQWHRVAARHLPTLLPSSATPLVVTRTAVRHCGGALR